MPVRTNLWPAFISRENFSLAAYRALRKKVKTSELLAFIDHKEELTERARQLVISGRFRSAKYTHKIIHEPKTREIAILPFWPDRLIHHAFMNILAPIWDGMFIRDSYACRPGYGLHAASRRCMQFVRRNKYFLQFDIRKFYPTIDTDILMSIIRRKIKDERLLRVVRDVIFSYDGTGIPIGNYCSQWFGNLYLNELDSFVKQRLRVADYIRYCDDFILFSSDKRQLGRWKIAVMDFVRGRLGQNFSLAEIAPVSGGVDFLGYRHFPHRILMRRTSLIRMRRMLRRIAKMPRFVWTRSTLIRGRIAAIRGWMAHANCKSIFPGL
ncbi:MAG: reverse transcriptase/maturase family protein [Rickettsiales bacterium]|jgi:hypothetical protein|nr:reverse transcriptase/maturase family protein [Rickettsiales bacterium]